MFSVVVLTVLLLLWIPFVINVFFSLHSYAVLSVPCSFVVICPRKRLTVWLSCVWCLPVLLLLYLLVFRVRYGKIDSTES